MHYRHSEATVILTGSIEGSNIYYSGFLVIVVAVLVFWRLSGPFYFFENNFTPDIFLKSES